MVSNRKDRDGGKRGGSHRGGNTKFDVKAGSRLRQFRRAKGVTQEQLAKAWGGVTYQVVQKHERGDSPLTLYRVVTAAKLIGFVPHDLVDEGDYS